MPFIAPENPRPVRAKMYVRSVDLQSWATIVTLSVVTRGEDNKTWASSTPSGEMKLNIANGVAAENFWPGQEWYIDMTPIPAGEMGKEGMG